MFFIAGIPAVIVAVTNPGFINTFRIMARVLGWFTGAGLWKTWRKRGHYDMERLLALLALCEGNHWELVDSPHKGSIYRILTVTMGGFASVNLWKNTRKIMIAWHGNAFHITGPSWGESTRNWLVLLTKGQYTELWWLLWEGSQVLASEKQKEKMTSQHRNAFHITDPLWGESTGSWWILFPKSLYTELWLLLWEGSQVLASERYRKKIDMRQQLQKAIIWNTHGCTNVNKSPR